MQQSAEQYLREKEGDSGFSVRGKTDVGSDIPLTLQETLSQLEDSNRYEFSNWNYDESQIPEDSGVVLYYSAPMQLLWVEEVDNLREALQAHVEGRPSDFLRWLLHYKVIRMLKKTEVQQLKEKRLEIETIMSFRVKQLISYRFCLLPDPEDRKQVVDLVWGGALKVGKPQFPRLE